MLNKIAFRLLAVVAFVGAGALALAPASAFASGYGSFSVSPSSIATSTTATYTVTFVNNTTASVPEIDIHCPANLSCTGMSLIFDTGSYSSGTFRGAFSSPPVAGATVTFTITATSSGTASASYFAFDTMLANGSFTVSDSTQPQTRPTFTVGTVATPTPTPNPTPTATPSVTPVTPPSSTDPVAPSSALAQFMQIFFTVIIAFSALIVPLMVLTWAIRLTANLVMGR